MGSERRFPIGSYCSSPAWGGLEMNVLRFLRWMRQRGWPTFLYAPKGTVIYQRAVEFDIPARSVRAGSPLSAVWRARGLALTLAADDVRVMTLHQSRDLLMAVLAKAHSGGRLRVVYSQHMHIASDKKDLLHAWQFRRLDAFVTPVPWLARHVLERTVLPAGKVHVITRGIEVERFANKPDRPAARRELNLPLDVPLLGIIGRLDPKKGQHVALKALRQVHDAGHQAHLLIVGAQTMHEDTGYEAHLKELVRQLKLSEFVHFRPHQPKPETALAALDVFVLASLCETYGMVTIEALTSGLPVIGTDDGGTTDLIEHGKNGLRFPPEDDCSLAEALLRLLNDPEFASSLARRAGQDAQARFSHTRQCDEWEGLLEGIIG